MSDRLMIEPGEIILSQCAYCAHLAAGPTAECMAFPAGIPAEILAGDADHRRAYSGDRGITFEAKPGVPAETLARLYRLLDQS